MKDKALNREVTRILNRDGQITASALVQESAKKSAPLHERFEWNDKKAGHEYRLIQARKMIRVAVVESNEGQERVVHVPSIEGGDSREGYYKPMSSVATNVDEFSLAYSELSMRLKSATKAAHDLEAAARKRDKGDDSMARIALAIKSMETAKTALDGLH